MLNSAQANAKMAYQGHLENSISPTIEQNVFDRLDHLAKRAVQLAQFAQDTADKFTGLYSDGETDQVKPIRGGIIGGVESVNEELYESLNKIEAQLARMRQSFPDSHR